mgnify:CR=1 FL=1
MNNDVLSKWQSKITHILIDEYQDTNTAQYLWIRLLCSKHNNICCVGDDDQSIYGWRGARSKNIQFFEDEFKEVELFKLEQNYRSTNEILSVANSLIANNKERLGKNLWTDTKKGNPDEKPVNAQATMRRLNTAWYFKALVFLANHENY